MSNPKNPNCNYLHSTTGLLKSLMPTLPTQAAFSNLHSITGSLKRRVPVIAPCPITRLYSIVGLLKSWWSEGKFCAGLITYLYSTAGLLKRREMLKQNCFLTTAIFTFHYWSIGNGLLFIWPGQNFKIYIPSLVYGKAKELSSSKVPILCLHSITGLLKRTCSKGNLLPLALDLHSIVGLLGRLEELAAELERRDLHSTTGLLEWPVGIPLFLLNVQIYIPLLVYGKVLSALLGIFAAAIYISLLVYGKCFKKIGNKVANIVYIPLLVYGKDILMEP